MRKPSKQRAVMFHAKQTKIGGTNRPPKSAPRCSSCRGKNDRAHQGQRHCRRCHNAYERDRKRRLNEELRHLRAAVARQERGRSA
jgi:uncharacterized paraquat-inducible protein A